MLAALVGLAALLAVASTGRADPTCTDSWNVADVNGAGVSGSWNVAANWDQRRVPTASDTACINLPGTYTVTFAGTATVADLEVGARGGPQTQTLQISAACSVTTTLTASAGNVKADGSIELTGQVCGNDAVLNMANGATLTNAGTLTSDPGAGGNRHINGNVTNTGTLTVNDPLGIDNLTNQGTVQLNSNMTLTGTTLTNAAGGTISIADRTLITAGSSGQTVTNNGTITASGSGQIIASGATFNAAAGSTLSGTLPLTMDGSTLNQQGGTISTVLLRSADNLSGDIPAGETLQISAACSVTTTVTAAGSLTNYGTIQLTGQVCGNDAVLNMANGATLTNAGTLTSDPGAGGNRHINGNVENGTTGNGGQPGTFKVNQPLSVQGGLGNRNGTVSVAAGQRLGISGDYVQGGAGDLAPQTASGTSVGVVDVSGSATLDGSVSLTAPPVTDSGPLTVLTAAGAGGLTGTFATANAVVSAPNGKYYLPSYTATAASLTAVTGSLSLVPAAGGRDSAITVNGTGWPSSPETVTIGFSDSAGTITRASGVATNGDGSFSTSINVPDGAAAGPAQVWLESRLTGGQTNRMTAKPFTVNVGAPTVTAVQPNSGPEAGGTKVTITGTDLAGAADLRFGGTRASQFNVDSNTQITATAPPGSSTVDITVTTRSGTSATSAADRYTYVQPTRPATTTPPTVSPGTVAATTTQMAALAATVNPHGSPTTVHFEYGLDDQYRPAGTTGIIYDQVTPDQPVGSGSGDVPVAASLSGLLPNARYHVRLVATNSAGSTRGPDQTFSTPADPPPPPPRLGRTENVKPASGTVFVVVSGRRIPLTEARQLPSGSVLDTRNGTIALSAAAGIGKKVQTGTFTGAVFKLTQTRAAGGLTTLAMLEDAFPGAPSYAACRAARAAAIGHDALSSRILQTLRSRASGRFRTRGRYAAATVRGTQWTTSDRCDGTLIAVQVHTVLVTDFVKQVTVPVKAGRSYLARARRR